MRIDRLFAAGVLAALPLVSAQYDVLIRNARILDGTGTPAVTGDVGILADKIVAVGKLDGATAARTIDARQHVLGPGFIDVHTHVELKMGFGAVGPVEKVPNADNFIRDGVTTLITGNCGHSETDLPAFFSRLEKARIAVNLGSLIGHNDVRRVAMGEANRKATAGEISRMKEVVARAMRDGAVGFSTGLVYVPGTYSDTEEVIALAKEAARFGGVYASHMRDEGDHVTQAIDEAVRVGKEARMPVHLSHFKIDNKRMWGASKDTIAQVERYRQQGLDVTIDQYPYDRSSTTLGHLVPSWTLADGEHAIRERFATPATRARIISEMRTRLDSLGHKDYSWAMVASSRPEPSFNGKTITEINRSRSGASGIAGEIDLILDLLGRDPTGTIMIYHKMGMVDVDRIMQYPHAAIASDGWVIEKNLGSPHPRSYGTNSRVLAEFVRSRKILTLADAVRKMTDLPAQKFSLEGRGRVAPGYFADIVLFDPDKIQDHATFAQPHQYSTGFDLVMVNGKVEVEKDTVTGTRAGRIVRRKQTAR
jgi:N-acyl-D-amino-acid deacylase